MYVTYVTYLSIMYVTYLSIMYDCILYNVFRDAVTKSAVLVTDKQDPALAAELSLYLFPIMYEAGYYGMGTIEVYTRSSVSRMLLQ